MFNSLGYNLIGVTSGSSGFTLPGDAVGSAASPMDPKLGPLANNGGLTFTMALLPAGPAIDAGVAAGAPATDQRGVARPQGAAVDVGAYEFRFTIPQITGAKLLPGSNFWLKSCGLSNQTYTLQASSNLRDWIDLTNLVADAAGVCEFVEGNSGGGAMRFYRLRASLP